MRALILLLALLLAGCSAIRVSRTYSIVGRDADGREIGASVKLEPPARGFAK